MIIPRCRSGGQHGALRGEVNEDRVGASAAQPITVGTPQRRARHHDVYLVREARPDTIEPQPPILVLEWDT